MKHAIRRLAALALAVPAFAMAQTSDAANDYVSTYTGNRTNGDLDVISAAVYYNPTASTFTLTATMNGAVGSTATNTYVWGVNRGAGTAGFAAQGYGGITWDKIINYSSSSSASNVGGVVTVSGSTITLVIDASLLPNNGFGFDQYTWNLWPRDTSQAGFAAIADFAPDNSNLATTAVPEPSSVALLIAGGAGLLAWRRRKSA